MVGGVEGRRQRNKLLGALVECWMMARLRGCAAGPGRVQQRSTWTMYVVVGCSADGGGPADGRTGRASSKQQAASFWRAFIVVESMAWAARSTTLPGGRPWVLNSHAAACRPSRSSSSSSSSAGSDGAQRCPSLSLSLVMTPLLSSDKQARGEKVSIVGTMRAPMRPSGSGGGLAVAHARGARRVQGPAFGTFGVGGAARAVILARFGSVDDARPCGLCSTASRVEHWGSRRRERIFFGGITRLHPAGPGSLFFLPLLPASGSPNTHPTPLLLLLLPLPSFGACRCVASQLRSFSLTLGCPGPASTALPADRSPALYVSTNTHAPGNSHRQR